MSGPDPVPEPAPPSPPAHRPGVNWHRVRVYVLSIMLIVAMWMGATLVTIRLHPERVVRALLAQLPYSSSTGKVYWLNRRTLKIDNLNVGDFFHANSVTLVASPWGLWRHHIAKVQIKGGQLFTKPFYAAMEQSHSGKWKGIDWVIGQLEIDRGTVMLDNVVAGSSIPVRLGTRHPIILRRLRLGEPDSSPSMMEVQTVEIGAVNISSPVDPLTPVLGFPLTRIRFTYQELWHHHIREVEMIRPIIYLGEDLFWLTDQFKKEHKDASAPGLGEPWVLDSFEVHYGRLAVNAFGQPVVHFPFFFGTKVTDIRFDQLNQVNGRSVIAIQRLDQDYPDYKIRLVGLTGRLYFSWPPSNAKANNVVNTIAVQEVSWNDIPVKGVSTTLTFDPNGVYGKLSGQCEGGQLDGNFEFYYTKGFTWNANLFANKINCSPIAEKLVGKYFELSGILNGRISVQGKATEILNCAGTLNLPNPGLLEFKSMGDLIDRLPSDTIQLKRDAAKIAIHTFQTYPYQTGQVKIAYKPTGGVGTLKLTGPQGLRSFEIYWHPWGSADDSVTAR